MADVLVVVVVVVVIVIKCKPKRVHHPRASHELFRVGLFVFK